MARPNAISSSVTTAQRSCSSISSARRSGRAPIERSWSPPSRSASTTTWRASAATTGTTRIVCAITIAGGVKRMPHEPSGPLRESADRRPARRRPKAAPARCRAASRTTRRPGKTRDREPRARDQAEHGRDQAGAAADRERKRHRAQQRRVAADDQPERRRDAVRHGAHRGLFIRVLRPEGLWRWRRLSAAPTLGRRRPRCRDDRQEPHHRARPRRRPRQPHGRGRQGPADASRHAARDARAAAPRAAGRRDDDQRQPQPRRLRIDGRAGLARRPARLSGSARGLSRRPRALRDAVPRDRAVRLAALPRRPGRPPGRAARRPTTPRSRWRRRARTASCACSRCSA